MTSPTYSHSSLMCVSVCVCQVFDAQTKKQNFNMQSDCYTITGTTNESRQQ